MKKYSVFAALFLSSALILSGCSDKNASNDNNTNITENDEADTGMSGEYKNAYDELVHFSELVKSAETVENPKEETVKFFYFVLPPVYDVIKDIEGVTYEQFEKYMTDSFVAGGFSDEEAKKMVDENGKAAYDSFIENFNTDNFNIFGEGNLADGLGINTDMGFDALEFVEENELTQDEIDLINSDLSLFNTMIASEFSNLGIGGKEYKTEKGYNAKFKGNDGTINIYFYYMNDEWRAYIPKMFEEIRGLFQDPNQGGNQSDSIQEESQSNQDPNQENSQSNNQDSAQEESQSNQDSAQANQ